MANNFKNAFASIVSAGEFYQSTGSATDNATGPQLVYNANNGSSGVNSILVELDASNTGSAGITLTTFIQDTSSTLGSITSIVSSTFTYAQNSGASNGTAAGTKVIYKAYHIVKDVSIPANTTLKIVSGQKIVLNANDKVYAYASAATCDIIAGILQEVS